MSYREPIERKLRLWFVTIAYAKDDGRFHACGWYWAKESESAIELALAAKGTQRTLCWSDSAVCAEDFVEREAIGPPAAAKP